MTAPPLKLTIVRASDVPNLLQTSRYDAVLSIRDPVDGESRAHKRHRLLRKHAAAVLCLDFKDNEFVPRHVVFDIIEFASQLRRGMHVLLHCVSGISRSTAAALILLREIGMPYGDAYTEVMRVRPIARPNVAMLCAYTAIVTKKLAPDTTLDNESFFTLNANDEDIL